MSYVPPESFDDDALESLVAECIALYETGGEDAVSEHLERHPEHSDRVRRRLEAARDLGLLGETESPLATAIPERVGDFRLLEKLGGGGMGLVYRAEQDPLGRPVAVKVMRPEQLFSEPARRRFRREMQAASRMQHPGIAAILTVGEQDGLPWFAMELIDGLSLAEVVEALAGRDPGTLSGADLRQVLGGASETRFGGSWEETCLTLVRQAAEALEHAHARGTLHRDVKPSNLMLARTGRVLVIDFGVARLEDADAMTASGTQPGSLLYMAPEQITGDVEKIDERADVYGLGVTLYELLTLERPFAETSGERLRRRVLDGAAIPPRRRNPRVSQEAETICLKAMAVDPAHRYTDAGSLARDLGNALAGRPLEGRRPGLARRLRSWTRRRPAQAAATLFAVLALMVAPTVIAWRESTRAGREADLRRDAELQRGLAVDARDAQKREADRYREVSGVMSSALRELNHGLQTRLSSKELLDRLAARAREDYADRPLVEAALLLEAGRNLERAGYHPTAAETLRRAWKLLDGHAAPDDAAKRECRALLAHSLVAQERFEPARGHIDALLDELSARPDPRLRLRVLRTRGLLHDKCRRWAEAIADYERVLESEEKMRMPDPAFFASCRSNLASVLTLAGRHADGLVEAEDALEELEASDPPDVLEVLTAMNHVGLAALASGDRRLAERTFRGAVARARRDLRDFHPHVARAEYQLGHFYVQVGRDDDAAPLFESAGRGLAKAEAALHRRLRAATFQARGMVEARRGNWQAAAGWIRRCLDDAEVLAPAERATRRRGLGVALDRAGAVDEAIEVWEVAIRETVEVSGGKDPKILRGWSILQRLHRKKGDAEGAVAAAREALAACDAMANPRAARFTALVSLGMELNRSEKTDEALQHLEDAIELDEQLDDAARRTQSGHAGARSAALTLLVRLHESAGNKTDADRYRRMLTRD